MAAEDDGPKAAKGGERRTGRDRRQRPPVTIDLTAAPVDPPKAAEPPAVEARTTPEAASPEPPPPPRPPDPPRVPPRSPVAAIGGDEGWTRLALVGAAGGLVALILVLVLQGIGVLPAPGRSAANQAAEQAKAASDATAGLERRLSAVEMLTEGVNASRGAMQQLGDRVARLESADTQLAPRDQVMALNAQVAALASKGDAGASRDDIAKLGERIARIESALAAGSGPAGGAATAAISVQNGRIDDVQASLKALAARLDALEGKVANGPAVGSEAARSVALVSLRRAAESGAPFASDLDMAAALGLAPADVATLRPLAEKGVASAAAIAGEMPADAILAASLAADPGAGFWQRLIGGNGGLVSVRPLGPVAGSDPAAIVSRMRAAVDKGDLAGALKEREALPQPGKDASAAWAAKARDRIAVDGLIARIADASARPAGN